MSEISLNVAPPPDLLQAASSQATSPLKGAGATGRNRPDAVAPADGSGAANPFAALLSGVFQGAQPAPPATVPADPGSARAPPFEAQGDDGTAAVALLALPDRATPLPATPGGTVDPASLSGNTLPVSGNLLPAQLSLPTDSIAGTPGTGPGPAPDANAATVPATTEPGCRRPAISLADLALSRPLEPAPGSADAIDRASADQTALALAGRSLALREARASQSGSSAQPLTPQSTTQNFTQGLSAVPEATDASRLALRLTAADFRRGTFVPAASSDFLAGQIAAFAASSDGGSATPGAAPLAESTGANTGLLTRPGTTTLPVLQPLGDASSFAVGLADRLVTLGGPGAHSARLQLHPEHLGELHVDIQMDGGSAQVWFGTTSSQAHDAIQASLPRLRELFADQGIQITRTQVDTGSTQMNHSASHQQGRMAGGAPYLPDRSWRPAAVAGTGALGGLPPAPRVSTRLVDVWA